MSFVICFIEFNERRVYWVILLKSKWQRLEQLYFTSLKKNPFPLGKDFPSGEGFR
jgi:hypothetical protein